MKHLLWACLRTEWVEVRRYWLNTLSALGVNLILFLMLYFGVRLFGTPQADFSALVVGYYAFSLTNVAFQRLAAFLIVEAQVGTLEQLALSPFGLWRVALARMATYLISALMFSGIALLTTMAITGVWLRVHPIGFPLMTLLLVGQAYGFGLVMGGLALLFKRVVDLMQLVSLMLVVFILTPVEGSLGYLVPLGQAWRLLQEWLQAGGLSQPASLGVEVVKTLLLLGGGGLVYWQCERTARQRGLLGRYA